MGTLVAGSTNLSDAYARQAPTASQRRVFGKLPQLYVEATSRSQRAIEEEFVDAFLRLAGQVRVHGYDRYQLSYSASCAITMVASHCRSHGLKVGLIEPARPRIASTLRREGVELLALPEWQLRQGVAGGVASSPVDVVWLVAPNSPTGWELSCDGLVALARHGAETGRLLVLDLGFRFFSATMATWQQQAILKSSGASYVVIEGTGKTWPTAGMQVAMLQCSDDLVPVFRRHHRDLLEHVSPLHLRVITELICDALAVGREAAIGRVPAENRVRLREVLADAPVSFANPVDSPVPVEWLRLPDDLTAAAVRARLLAEGIDLTPGDRFFWSNPMLGAHHLRVPLARDPEVVAFGMASLKAVLHDVASPAGAAR